VDWNEDGHPDIVTDDGWFSGGGDRSFAGKDFGWTPVTHAMRVLDLDRDGHLDWVGAMGGGYDSTLAIFYGDGSGHPRQFTSIAVPSVHGLAFADFDGDGRLDVVASSASGTLAVVLRRADGSFSPRIEVPTGLFPADLI